MKTQESSYNLAALFALSLRLVVGWTYFSAFWRRVVLENKLDPELPGYIGQKFNHFLPNAIGIQPIIEYLVTHPEALHRAMVTFTIIEALVGLGIILGIATRVMSIGVLSLAMGILLGSGWLGTTCLDEWQIGVLGVASGAVLFFAGGGLFSVDALLEQKGSTFTKKRWYPYFFSGKLPWSTATLNKVVPLIALFIFGLTLYTNQVFHGGLWGTLHNKSVKPKVEISNVVLTSNALQLDVYRVEGADVYGSFVIAINLLDEKNEVLWTKTQEELAELKANAIQNYYIAQVKAGKHSLVLPLGAKATLNFVSDDFQKIKNQVAKIQLVDISGLQWETKF
ncbi:quinol oxidase [Flavobacterium sediminis]|uniref:Quinol oxidase n=1 Tax=Flavobacterium sediminis TaxID=2201181 RepID=A0A2U8QR59_9FLAO|nr:TQO small subunit DoxD [Flavobacterium sediminis]AWM12561.1 quinol oxidase [Flavobacterium sediminis]